MVMNIFSELIKFSVSFWYSKFELSNFGYFRLEGLIFFESIQYNFKDIIYSHHLIAQADKG